MSARKKITRKTVRKIPNRPVKKLASAFDLAVTGVPFNADEVRGILYFKKPDGTLYRGKHNSLSIAEADELERAVVEEAMKYEVHGAETHRSAHAAPYGSASNEALANSLPPLPPFPNLIRKTSAATEPPRTSAVVPVDQKSNEVQDLYKNMVDKRMIVRDLQASTRDTDPMADSFGQLVASLVAETQNYLHYVDELQKLTIIW